MVKYKLKDGKMKRSKNGDFVKVKSVINLLKSFDYDDEIIKTMDYIIKSEFKDK